MTTDIKLSRSSSSLLPSYFKWNIRCNIGKRLALTLSTAFLLQAPSMASSINETMTFSSSDHVMVKTVEQTDTKMSFLVASNAPFALVAWNVDGPITSKVQSQDRKGLGYGHNAFAINRTDACKAVQPVDKHILFETETRTAALPGTILSQSVLVSVSYESSDTPHLWIGPKSRVETKHPDANGNCARIDPRPVYMAESMSGNEAHDTTLSQKNTSYMTDSYITALE